MDGESSLLKNNVNTEEIAKLVERSIN